MEEFRFKRVVYGYEIVSLCTYLDPKKFSVRKDGYILLNRYVLENVLGRKLAKNEVVHHINGDKLDNRPENLQLLTRAQHAKLHHYGVPKGEGFRRRMEKTHKHQGKPVKRINLKNGAVKVYQSVGSAARKNGVSRPNLIKVLRGRLKKSGGYGWKYVDSDDGRYENWTERMR